MFSFFRSILSKYKLLHPRKLTWILKMMVCNLWLLLNMAILDIYVRFRGCNGEHHNFSAETRKKSSHLLKGLFALVIFLRVFLGSAETLKKPHTYSGNGQDPLPTWFLSFLLQYFPKISRLKRSNMHMIHVKYISLNICQKEINHSCR